MRLGCDGSCLTAQSKPVHYLLGLVLTIPFYPLVGPNAALAQEAPARFELFVQAGASTLTDEARSFSDPFNPVSVRYKSSFGATARLFAGLRYYFTPDNAFEVSYSYSPNRLQSTFVYTPLAPSPSLTSTQVDFVSESMGVNIVAFNCVKYLPAQRVWKPFVTGGLGFAVFDYAVQETKFAGNFGGGMEVPLNGWLSLRAEFRDFVIQRPRFTSFTSVAHNLAPSVGLVLKF